MPLNPPHHRAWIYWVSGQISRSAVLHAHHLRPKVHNIYPTPINDNSEPLILIVPTPIFKR